MMCWRWWSFSLDGAGYSELGRTSWGHASSVMDCHFLDWTLLDRRQQVELGVVVDGGAGDL